MPTALKNAGLKSETAMPRTLNVGAPSIFVTLTAWFALVLAVGVAVVTGLQYAHVDSMLPQWQQRELPLVSGWLLRDLPWVLATAAALSLALAASAVGLLLRLDWARRSFIGLAGLAIAAHLLGLWLQHELVQVLVQGALGPMAAKSALPQAALGLFGSLATAAQVMGGVVTLAAVALLAWVIGRLRSESVRQEFA